MKSFYKITLVLIIAVLTVLSCKKKDYSMSGLPDKSAMNI